MRHRHDLHAASRGHLKEESGEGLTEKLRQYEIYRQMLADCFNEPAEIAMNKVEEFEQDVKKKFIEDPGQMRLLIVVDKLLTGFDAPPATYLYIDKTMRDHGLFQAICRVNRLDGEDKDYGYIVDYSDLFNAPRAPSRTTPAGLSTATTRRTSRACCSDRLQKAREDLDEALETVRALCEPVEPPKHTLQYQRYFCASEPGNARQLKANEPKRVELYKAVSAVVRAYANLANEMDAAGYSAAEAAAIRAEVAHYAKVRDEVKLGAARTLTSSSTKPAMRFLLDTYIQADSSEKVADFGDIGLIQLIVQLGADAIAKLPKGIRNDPEAVAETIANNVRSSSSTNMR